MINIKDDKHIKLDRVYLFFKENNTSK